MKRGLRILAVGHNHQPDFIRKVAIAYLQRDLVYAGMIPRDRAVADAVRRRQPFAEGDGPASQALRTLAVKLKAERWKE